MDCAAQATDAGFLGNVCVCPFPKRMFLIASFPLHASDNTSDRHGLSDIESVSAHHERGLHRTPPVIGGVAWLICEHACKLQGVSIH